MARDRDTFPTLDQGDREFRCRFSCGVRSRPGTQVAVVETAAEHQGRQLWLGPGGNSYVDKPDEPVTLVVQMNTLPDGALYSAQTTLDAKAKNIQIVIANSCHKPVAR
jgi:hypothetical protein